MLVCVILTNLSKVIIFSMLKMLSLIKIDFVVLVKQKNKLMEVIPWRTSWVLEGYSASHGSLWSQRLQELGWKFFWFSQRSMGETWSVLVRGTVWSRGARASRSTRAYISFSYYLATMSAMQINLQLCYVATSTGSYYSTSQPWKQRGCDLN